MIIDYKKQLKLFLNSYNSISKIKFYFKIKIRILTITDIKILNKLIYFSYNFKIATRVHHLPTLNKYELPITIINSFVFKHFSKLEQDFIYSCKEINSLCRVSKYNKDYEFIKLSTGKQLMIIIYDNKKNKSIMQLKINDLSKFTGLFRKYKNPMAVESIINNIFGNNNVKN